ncbi:MAG: tetratricopeptide repeat protein [Paludibacteraceae bacterium]|nr:tetratricopeptide repeat protein [Paludibacteraceae bacterium]
MAKKNLKNENEQTQKKEEALSSVARWLEKNDNRLTWILTGIIVVVLGIVAYNSYVIKPKGAIAADENAKCEMYFMQGDYEKALNGDENDCLGFEEVATQYGFHKEGKLAALYAGICYYELGNYEEAVNYIKKYKAKDLMINPSASQMLGDVYVEMGEYEEAVRSFMAAAKSGNKLIAPMSLKKAGIVYLEMDDKAAAKKVFTTIKTDYRTSQEAADIDKYIAICE